MEKKQISIKRLKELERYLGAVSNPDMFDWDIAEIPCEGGEELLSKLQAFRKSFKELNECWKNLTGEPLK